MNIGVQIDAGTMERVEAMLAQVPKGAERAFSNAINRGLSKVKTGAFREVKRVYTVQSSALLLRRLFPCRVLSAARFDPAL